jgi:transposase-like protein
MHDLAETLAEPSRVAVDEKQIEVDGEKKWLYAAIDTDSKLLLGIGVYSRRGTDPAAAFSHRLTEKHDVAGAESLVDGGRYLTVLFGQELSVNSTTESGTTSKAGSRQYRYESTAFIRFSGAVSRVLVAG